MAVPTYMYAAVSTGYIYVSSDSGTTWTEKTTPGSKAWRRIRCDSTGQYVLAFARNNNYWVSDDFGDTWTEVSTNRDWRGGDVSGDGATMIIGSFDGNNPRISTDYGVTWSNANAGTNNADLASDYDGSSLIRAHYGNYIELSTDSDANWNNSTGAGSRNWRAVSISHDGATLLGAYDGGGAYYSTNSGSSWSSAGLTITWAGKANISPNGSVLIVIADGKSHISTNSGTSWTSDSNSENWNDMVASNTGTYLLGARTKSGASYPHISSDSGANWTALSGAGSKTWATVAMSTNEPSGWSNDFNGVANASIAKINGIAIASIAKVNGIA